MSEVLKVSYTPSSGSTIFPSKEIHEHAQKLNEIRDLRSKFRYYNQHICSLSYSFHEGLHLYGSYDHFHGYGDLFYRKAKNQKNDPEFEIYLDERQNEIDRLKKLLESKNNYAQMLQCFLEEKAGQIRFHELKVHSNAYERFIVNGGGTVPAHLQGNNNLINLEPWSSEIKDFNLYLYGYVEKIIANPKGLHKLKEEYYKGLLVIEAVPAFDLQLSNALRKEDTIYIKKTEIERQFRVGNIPHYIDLLYPYEIKDIAEWQSAVFNAFVYGYNYDFSRRKLNVEEVKAFYHVEQVFKFYKHLLNQNNSLNTKADTNAQRQGFVFKEESVDEIDEFIERMRDEGLSTYNRINKELANIVIEYNKQVYNHSLNLTELELLYRQLQQSTKLLKDRLNKTMEEMPDAATVLSSFEVIRSNGEKYIVNDGLEEKIEQRYKATIESLEGAKEIVKEKIDNLFKGARQKGNPRNTQKPGLQALFKKPEYYNRCIQILDQYEASALTPKKGYVLFAIIDAMKDKSQTLFNKNYRDEDLLAAFNSHLNKEYRQLKRNAKDFKTIKAEVKQLLSNL